MTQRRSHPSLYLLALLTAAAPACTSDASPNAAGGTSTTSGMGSETTASEASESANTDGADGSTGGTGQASESTDTDESECLLPQDDALGGAVVTITIENTTAEPKFIAPYSTSECNYAQVEVLLEGEPILWDHAGAAPVRCTACGRGCSDGGAQGLIINPGETAEVSWNGGYWANTELSESCVRDACQDSPGWTEDDLAPGECQALRAMEDAEYTVRVNVLDTCPGLVDEAGECDCDEGVCEAFFYEPSPGDYTVEASATFPAGAAILLE